jgi:anti-sigma factor RsiW
VTASFGGSRAGGGHLGDALSGLLDGELDRQHADAARVHLLACPDCAAELHAVTRARAWVRALPPVEAPFGFYERVLLDHRPAPPAPPAVASGLRRRAGLAALGAAAAAATVLGVGSPRQSPVSPSVPRMIEAHATGASVGADLLSKLAPMGVPVSFGR